MIDNVQSYPLTWPPGFQRTKFREPGRFKTTLAGALKNVQDSLRLFARDSGKKLESLVISSNVTLGEQRPDNPGVAVWFIWDGLQVCIPVDRYQSVAANLQAIHHIIESRRVELRHGTLSLVRASFTGFKALPPPPGGGWREVLQIAPGEPTVDQIKSAYRALAEKYHPDKGGSTDAMAQLTHARDTALKEIGA